MIEDIEYDSTKCATCHGPFHPATGTIISIEEKISLCGICSGKFYAWRQAKDGNKSQHMSKKRRNRLSKKHQRASLREQKKRAIAEKEAELFTNSIIAINI